MKKIYYSEQVDKHIYNIKDGCQTVDDWIDLAFAAFDQSGMSVKSLHNLSKEVAKIVAKENLYKNTKKCSVLDTMFN